MSSLNLHTSIQKPNSLRPERSVNLRKNHHFPSQPRPISQETTYTDHTSRRGSLESNPPHLSPGERPQIMIATPPNLGPQVPTPPPSPPLLERKSGFKKWICFVAVGAASLMVILMLITIVLLVAFGTKKHSSTIYVQATVPVSNGTETTLSVVPAPRLGKRGGWMSTKKTTTHKLADIVIPDQHTLVPISILMVSDGVTIMATSEIATREADSMVTGKDGDITTSTTNMRSTEAAASTLLMSPASVVTQTVTAAPKPEPTAAQTSQLSTTDPPPALITVKLQFTIKESREGQSAGKPALMNILSTALMAGIITVCQRLF
ncbi:hypothetical protein ONS95_000494 [Cadophora gregata]|uniref:uncharacterized protein n=1 Tax=Cadophora gregata TaxID=51156 RepID=UPI0026DCCA43|nr:uncharacterized protein ONS95_000494 [Cadophora gregata]KAK0125498.1 hypothetical protein ONS96_009335 [Cadophora gregata f. sp. sojae]KAK0128527.1 hypothetical protein ONS95_000494 [Cadophora gregata]